MEVNSLKQIGLGSPCQWQFTDEYRRPVYVRFDWGKLDVRVGPQDGILEEALYANDTFIFQISHIADRFIEWKEIEETIKDINCPLS